MWEVVSSSRKVGLGLCDLMDDIMGAPTGDSGLSPEKWKQRYCCKTLHLTSKAQSRRRSSEKKHHTWRKKALLPRAQMQ